VSSSSFSTILEFRGINANLRVCQLHEFSSLKKEKEMRFDVKINLFYSQNETFKHILHFQSTT
jgi:hypothetical protein